MSDDGGLDLLLMHSAVEPEPVADEPTVQVRVGIEVARQRVAAGDAVRGSSWQRTAVHSLTSRTSSTERACCRPRRVLPFLKWLHAADPTSATLTLADLDIEPTIYLVPECGDAEEERAALQTVFATICEDQLGGWWRDRTTWPTSRAFDTFTRWFDCQFHSMLLDLTDEPLIEKHV